MNEFALRDGTPFESRPTASQIHTTYADSWRITNEESLFTYAEGESTETFTDMGFPSRIARISDYSETEQNEARALCASFGIVNPILLDACILDALVTNNDLAIVTGGLEAVEPVVIVGEAMSGELNQPTSGSVAANSVDVHEFTITEPGNFYVNVTQCLSNHRSSHRYDIIDPNGTTLHQGRGCQDTGPFALTQGTATIRAYSPNSYSGNYSYVLRSVG